MGDSRKVRNCYYGQWGFRSDDARSLKPGTPVKGYRKILLRLYEEEHLNPHPWQRRGYPSAAKTPRGKDRSRGCRSSKTEKVPLPEGFGWWSKPVRDLSAPGGIRRHDREGRPLMSPHYQKQFEFEVQGIRVEDPDEDREDFAGGREIPG